MRSVAAVLLFLLAASACVAQAPLPYTYDSTFLVGAHFARHPEVEKLLLHFDFGQYYDQPHLGLNTAVVRDSTLWPPSSDEDVRHDWRLDRDLYNRIDSFGFKVIFAPSIFARTVKAALSAENYFGHVGDTVALHDFGDTIPGDHDYLPTALTFGVRVPPTSPPTPVQVVSRPRFTAGAMRAPDSSFDELANIPGLHRYFDLTLTMKAGSLDRRIRTLGDSTLLGYALLWIRDTTGQRRTDACKCNFYRKVDSFAVTRAKYLASDSAGNGYLDVTFTFDFTRGTDSSGAPVWKYPNGLFFGWGTGRQVADSCGARCAALLGSLRAGGLISDSTIDLPFTVEEGDVFYSFHSTREVPVTFLRGRIGPHLLWALQHDSLDRALRGAIDSVYADPLLRRSLLRLGIHDETHFDTYRSFQSIASRAQRWMGSHVTGGPLGLWSNPHSQAQTLRIISGDLDSTEVKMIQLMAVQPYTLVQSILPVAYANPDSMHGSTALFDLYRARQTGTAPRMIAYNSAGDHLAYDTTIYRFLRGKLATFKDAIDLSRFRFPHIPTARPYPVWPVVEAHGFNNAGSYGRIPTPQEITAQAWGALHLHPDGLMFSDFEWDNANLGIVHIVTGGHDSEYAAMCDPKPSNSASCYPLMWVGMRSRFAAVKSFMDELQSIKPTYTKLGYSPLFAIVAEDTAGILSAALDTIYTRRARPYDTTLTGEPVDGPADSPDSTWLAVSVFEPGAQLAGEAVLGVRYLMVTNLRCWPVDRRLYGDSARFYGTTYGHADAGLGAIDARRPVVRFRNIWPAGADSLRIERVGHESAWSRVVAASDIVDLEWLEPGLGALYRVLPMPRRSSPRQ